MTTLPSRVLATPIGPALDLDALAARAAGLAEDARSANTRRAYRSDWDHFARWCTALGFAFLPADPMTVGSYLADHETRLSVATLTRRLSAIAVRHRAAGFALDIRHSAIADVMWGLRNWHGSVQPLSEALTIPRLRQALDRIGDRRDRALLLVGTAAALRRSELVALDVADITVQPSRPATS